MKKSFVSLCLLASLPHALFAKGGISFSSIDEARVMPPSVASDKEPQVVLDDVEERERRLVIYPGVVPQFDADVLQRNMEDAMPDFFRGSAYFQQTARPFALMTQHYLRYHPHLIYMPNLIDYALEVRAYIETLLIKYPEVQFFLDEINAKLERPDALDYRWLAFLGLRLQTVISKPIQDQTRGIEKKWFGAMTETWREDEVLEAFMEKFDGIFLSEEVKAVFASMKEEGVRYPYPVHVPMYGYNFMGIAVLVESFLQNIFVYGAEDVDVYQQGHGSLWNTYLLANHDRVHGLENLRAQMLAALRVRGFVKGLHEEGPEMEAFMPVFDKMLKQFSLKKMALLREAYHHLFKLYLKHFANPRDMDVFTNVMVAFFEFVHEDHNAFDVEHVVSRSFEDHFVFDKASLNRDAIASKLECPEHTFLRDDALELGDDWVETGFFKIVEARDKIGLLQMLGVNLTEPTFTGDDESDFALARTYLTEIQYQLLLCKKVFCETALWAMMQEDESGETLSAWFARRNNALENGYLKALHTALETAGLLGVCLK